MYNVKNTEYFKPIGYKFSKTGIDWETMSVDTIDNKKALDCEFDPTPMTAVVTPPSECQWIAVLARY